MGDAFSVPFILSWFWKGENPFESSVSLSKVVFSPYSFGLKFSITFVFLNVSVDE